MWYKPCLFDAKLFCELFRVYFQLDHKKQIPKEFESKHNIFLPISMNPKYHPHNRGHLVPILSCRVNTSWSEQNDYILIESIVRGRLLILYHWLVFSYQRWQCSHVIAKSTSVQVMAWCACTMPLSEPMLTKFYYASWSDVGRCLLSYTFANLNLNQNNFLSISMI